MAGLSWRNRGHAPSSLEGQDHTTDVVPLRERRGPVTMALLWITMVTGFPTVLVGFEWYKAGLSLPQILVCAWVSCAVLLAYTIPAAYLGAISGQTYGLLSRGVFGRWGSFIVSANLVWIAVGWYGLTAFFLAEGLQGLFHLAVPTAALAAGCAVLMAVNNFFGFTGVANFARYLAAPVLIGWVFFTFFKAVEATPAIIMTEPSQQAFPAALTLVSSFVIGYGAWGNEPDYWRYGKPRLGVAVVPLVVALVIGQVIFPATGWMLARMTGVTSYAGATELMNTYAFGGVPLLAAFVLIVAYVAVNDSCLYGIINALENVREMPRKKVVAVLTVLGAVSAALLSGYARAFESVASLSCVFLPSATVIMMGEWFVFRRLLGYEADLSRVSRLDELPRLRWPAVVALAGGCGVGLMTAGVIPGTESLHIGVSSLQAWLVSLTLYLPLRYIEHVRQAAASRELLEKLLVSCNSVEVPTGTGAGEGN